MLSIVIGMSGTLWAFGIALDERDTAKKEGKRANAKAADALRAKGFADAQTKLAKESAQAALRAKTRAEDEKKTGRQRTGEDSPLPLRGEANDSGIFLPSRSEICSRASARLQCVSDQPQGICLALVRKPIRLASSKPARIFGRCLQS